MNRHLHPEVVAELTDRFSPHDRAAAQTLLGSSSAAAHDPVGAARVDLAAIKAANGSLEGLKAAITLAAVDWRDLLVRGSPTPIGNRCSRGKDFECRDEEDRTREAAR